MQRCDHDPIYLERRVRKRKRTKVDDSAQSTPPRIRTLEHSSNFSCSRSKQEYNNDKENGFDLNVTAVGGGNNGTSKKILNILAIAAGLAEPEVPFSDVEVLDAAAESEQQNASNTADIADNPVSSNTPSPAASNGIQDDDVIIIDDIDVIYVTEKIAKQPSSDEVIVLDSDSDADSSGNTVPSKTTYGIHRNVSLPLNKTPTRVSSAEAGVKANTTTAPKISCAKVTVTKVVEEVSIVNIRSVNEITDISLAEPEGICTDISVNEALKPVEAAKDCNESANIDGPMNKKSQINSNAKVTVTSSLKHNQTLNNLLSTIANIASPQSISASKSYFSFLGHAHHKAVTAAPVAEEIGNRDVPPELDPTINAKEEIVAPPPVVGSNFLSVSSDEHAKHKNVAAAPITEKTGNYDVQPPQLDSTINAEEETVAPTPAVKSGSNFLSDSSTEPAQHKAAETATSTTTKIDNLPFNIVSQNTAAVEHAHLEVGTTTSNIQEIINHGVTSPNLDSSIKSTAETVPPTPIIKPEPNVQQNRAIERKVVHFYKSQKDVLEMESEDIKDSLSFIINKRKKFILRGPEILDNVLPAKIDATKSFTFLSYNVLSQSKIQKNPRLFPNIARCPTMLTWEERWKLLTIELNKFLADICCLQEIEKNEIENFYNPFMVGRTGYTSFYAWKKGGKGSDGCGIYWNSEKFKKMNQIIIPWSYISVAQILHLKHKKTRKELFVVNAHLVSESKSGFERLYQLAAIFAHLHKVRTNNQSVIFCGNFGKSSLSQLYKFINNGEIHCGVCKMENFSIPEDLKVSNDCMFLVDSNAGGTDNKPSKMHHSFNFQSVYGMKTYANNNVLTTYHYGKSNTQNLISNVGNPDFIFYSVKQKTQVKKTHQEVTESDLFLHQRLSLPDKESLERLMSPDIVTGSDHLPLYAEFSLQ